MLDLLSLSNSFSENINFAIIVVSIVLIGIIFTRLFEDKKFNFKAKETKTKILLLVFLFFVLIFFNLALIIDAFSVPEVPVYIGMGVSFIGVFICLLIFLFGFTDKLSKKNIIASLITIILGIHFYIIETLLGLREKSVITELIELGIMITILILVYRLVVLFLIKAENRKKK